MKLTPKVSFWVLFGAILAIGIFARVWEFDTVPGGLHQDEASIGVDAFSLLRFGVDRNGVSFPVNFISWGNGMDALDGYVLIPFIAIFGLTSVIVRLPSLLSGIFSLVIVYFVAIRIFEDEKIALLSMFLLAISPWHILMSRWGINENVLPFVFMVGFSFILTSKPNNYNYPLGCVFLALSLYAYGAAYVASPVFLICATVILLVAKRVNPGKIILGVLLYSLLITPIALFVLINTFKWETIQVGLVTIPRLPVLPRFESVAAVFTENSIRHQLLNNFLGMFNFLIHQTDGQIFNVVEPYGYLYTITFPLAVIGMVILFPFKKNPRTPEQLILLSWLGAAFTVGLLQPATINRMCLIFIPLFICVALFIRWVGKYSRIFLIASIIAFLVGFVFFSRDYHGKTYQEQSAIRFFPGFVSALNYARNLGIASDPICVTGKVNMPYVFVEFAEQTDPREFLNTIEYIDPQADFRRVKTMGRYTFGLQNCVNLPRTIYLTRYDEMPPLVATNYVMTRFDYFLVFIPKP
jgi:hypothetical protein